jgi:hypothetical protein
VHCIRRRSNEDKRWGTTYAMPPSGHVVTVLRPLFRRWKYPAAKSSGGAHRVFRTNPRTAGCSSRQSTNGFEAHAASAHLLKGAPGSALFGFASSCFEPGIGSDFVNAEPVGVLSPCVSIHPRDVWLPCASWQVWLGAKAQNFREPIVSTLKGIQVGF